MGDVSDWLINEGISAEGQYIESRSKARNLSNDEIVERLLSYDNSEEQILDEAFAEKVQSICQWYQEKGFLTKKQRSCLNRAFAELDLIL